MDEKLVHILVTAMYFIALINPVSKVSVLAILSSQNEDREFRRVASRATLVAAGILLGSLIFGNFILMSLFRVELHSLRISGGAVLFWAGFKALRHGLFFEQEAHARLEEVAIVPLACPMIAGPATIAACIGLRPQEGFPTTFIAILIAVSVNHAFMLFSKQVGSVLGRFNLLGAIVRLTGLVVMTIGTQMILDGISAWQAL